MRITIAAPAKVNLWLRVGPLRSTGFHDVDTLYCALDLADDVVLRAGEPGRGIRLGIRHAPPLEEAPDLGPILKNLALQAARAFQVWTGTPPNLRIALLKRIPPGGGLGGGSSDAAAVLRGLRRMHPERISEETLLTLAADLGSDVPFFLTARSLARGEGRGERLTPLAPLPPRPVVLVLPPFPVATADAYRWLDEDRGEDAAGDEDAARDEGAAPAADVPSPGGAVGGPGTGPGRAEVLTWERVETLAHNDFEGPVFARHPELGGIRDRLLEAGAAMAHLAGSGSTLFGVFDDREAAEAAAASIGREDSSLRVLVAGTRPR